MSSGLASRCAQNPGNRAQPGDSDQKDGRKAARTFATMTEARAATEASARLSPRPPGRRWKAHRSVSCDRKSDMSWKDPFRALRGHLENDFQFDRRAERKTSDAIHEPARTLVFSEDVLQQLRSGVSDFRLIADIPRGGHRH